MDIRNPDPRPIGPPPHGAQSIAKPARHEGIGNALRSAFDAGPWGMPDDMRQLLARLDR